MIKLKHILKELNIIESGIRNIRALAAQQNKADLYFHMDLDGVTSAIGMKAYLERYGVKVVNTYHIQYGGREYAAPKPTPGHMVVIVDFAHGKPMVTIHTDHHDKQSGVDIKTSSSFKKTPSNVQTISQEISPSDIFPNEDIKIISTVDSADFARQGLSVDDVINTSFKFDKSRSLASNKMAMGLVTNKIILAFKNSPNYLENIVMQSKPSLISIYTVAMDNAKKAGLKPEDLGVKQSEYLKSQSSKIKKIQNPSDVLNLGNGEYGLFGTVLIQYGIGKASAGGYDRYAPFKMVPAADYLVMGYSNGLVQAAVNPFKKGTNPFNLGDIGKKILNKYKSQLQSIKVSLRDIKRKMESDIKTKGSSQSFGFTMEDLVALFNDSIIGMPTGKKKVLIDMITNKHYESLTELEKQILEKIKVPLYDLILKQSGGHRNITNIQGFQFMDGDYLKFLKTIMQEFALELEGASLN